jgi:hypothetical protein
MVHDATVESICQTVHVALVSHPHLIERTEPRVIRHVTQRNRPHSVDFDVRHQGQVTEGWFCHLDTVSDCVSVVPGIVVIGRNLRSAAAFSCLSVPTRERRPIGKAPGG